MISQLLVAGTLLFSTSYPPDVDRESLGRANNLEMDVTVELEENADDALMRLASLLTGIDTGHSDFDYLFPVVVKLSGRILMDYEISKASLVEFQSSLLKIMSNGQTGLSAKVAKRTAMLLWLVDARSKVFEEGAGEGSFLARYGSGQMGTEFQSLAIAILRRNPTTKGLEVLRTAAENSRDSRISEEAEIARGSVELIFQLAALSDTEKVAFAKRNIDFLIRTVDEEKITRNRRLVHDLILALKNPGDDVSIDYLLSLLDQEAYVDRLQLAGILTQIDESIWRKIVSSTFALRGWSLRAIYLATGDDLTDNYYAAFLAARYADPYTKELWPIVPRRAK